MEKSQIRIIVQQKPGSKETRILIMGSTKKYREELAALGFRWGKTAAKLGIFDFGEERLLGWFKYVPEEDLHEQLAAISFLNASIVEDGDPYSRLYSMISADDLFIIKEDYKANWNGKVYASPEEGSYVFISGKKTLIPEEDAVLLKKPTPPGDLIAKYNLKVRR